MESYLIEHDNGQVYGPIDETGLIGWAREGRIAPMTRVRNTAAGQAVAAWQVPVLQSIFDPNAAPAYAAPATPAYGQPQYAQAGYAQAAYGQPIGYATPYGMSTHHQLSRFSVAGVVLLHIFTFGIFSFFYWPLMHGNLPRNRYDDPSGGKALGFCFIPFFNLYWLFFVTLRLVDRINEQRVARGLPPVSKGIFLAACIVQVIPYVNFLVGIFLWPISWGILQSHVNELVRRS